MAKKDKKKRKEKKVKETEQLRNISSNKILVRVYKDFGSNTAILKAEYEAEERRDAYNNLISVNKEFLHDEDTDFTVDDVYHNMEVLLNFKNRSKEDKIKILTAKITKQNRIIQYLEKFPEINAVYNYSDEDLKLRDYELMKEYTENVTGQGAYFTIEKGRRVYSFDSVDGFLVPIWRGVATHTQYPDHTRKKKIIIQEDIILKTELQKYNINKKLGNLLVWGMIAITILFGLNIWGGLRILEMNHNIDEKMHSQAFQCVEYTSKINQLFAEAAAIKLLPEPDPIIQEDVNALEPKTIG